MKPIVAFICVHNSCRSQMAEAIAKLKYSDVFDAFSAGTALKPIINQMAVRVVNEKYNLNMNETQHSKLISDIPKADIVITMGCEVECPYVPSEYSEDWGLDDPTGKPIKEFEMTLKLIEEKMLKLSEKIQSRNS